MPRQRCSIRLCRSAGRAEDPAPADKHLGGGCAASADGEAGRLSCQEGLAAGGSREEEAALALRPARMMREGV